MKTWMTRFAGVAAVAVTASAFAVTISQNVNLPGVDAGGNLSAELGRLTPVRVTINTRTGAFRASGRGKVQNQSNAKQTYINTPVDIPNVTVASSRYVVAKSGACTVSAAGTGILQ